MIKKDFSPLRPERTLDLLLTRIRQRGDLPGFSRVVSAIVSAMRGDDDREFSMTRTVLSDPALTQRVLRLANSAMYSVFGRSINTVSKAVIVLGTETIGHLALGLKLIDGLSAASQSTATTRGEMEKAVLAGQIARQVASSSSPPRDTEEVVVCSVLHSLGRLMVSFYLPEYWEQVQQEVAEQGGSENEAAANALGLSLDEIGRQIAKHWGLPNELVASLKEVPPRSADDAPLGHAEWLAVVSSMATQCATVLCQKEGVADTALAEVAEAYAGMLGFEAPVLLAEIESAHMQLLEERRSSSSDETDDEIDEPLPESEGKPEDAIEILRRGVSDLRSDLLSVSTTQLMTVALETVYQGLGLGKAIAFLRNQDAGKYVAQMSFGGGAEELLPRLTFSDAYQPDVFHAALASNKMIHVADAHVSSFSNKLPGWWREELGVAHSFVILPLMLNFHPVGFLYGDWQEASSPESIASDEVALLDDLRAILVKAIEHRCKIDPAWAHAMH